jgi:hypothetical protein
MDVRGVPLSFRERRVPDKQKSERLAAAAVNIGMTAFNFRVGLKADIRAGRVYTGPERPVECCW